MLTADRDNRQQHYPSLNHDTSSIWEAGMMLRSESQTSKKIPLRRSDGSPQHLIEFPGGRLSGSLPRPRLLSWFQHGEILQEEGQGGDFQASRAAKEQPFIYTDLPG